MSFASHFGTFQKLLFILILVVCAPMPLHAYEFTRCGVNSCYWERYPVGFSVSKNVENLFDGAQDVVINSFKRWESDRQTFCTLDFQYDGLTDIVWSSNSPDFKNVIFKTSSGWDYGEQTLALTLCYYEANGKVVDCDIAINAQDYVWSADGAPGTYNLTDTITHEIGHFWGLGHSEVEEATMYAYYREKIIASDLDEDDIRAAADAFCNGQMPPDDEYEQNDSLWMASTDFTDVELPDLLLYDKDVFRLRNKGGAFPKIEILDEDDERYKFISLYAGTAGDPDFLGASWCMGECVVAPTKKAIDTIASYVMVETNFDCSSISVSPYHMKITQVDSVSEQELSDEPAECADIGGDNDSGDDENNGCGCAVGSNFRQSDPTFGVCALFVLCFVIAGMRRKKTKPRK